MNHLYFTDQLCGFAGSLGPSQVTMSGPDLSLGAGKGDGLGVTAALFGSRGILSPANSSSRHSSFDGGAIIVAVTEEAPDGSDAEAMLEKMRKQLLCYCYMLRSWLRRDVEC